MLEAVLLTDLSSLSTGLMVGGAGLGELCQDIAEMQEGAELAVYYYYCCCCCYCCSKGYLNKLSFIFKIIDSHRILLDY